MQAIQVIGFANEFIGPLAQPLGPVRKTSFGGRVKNFFKTRYHISTQNPKYSEAFLAMMVLGFSVTTWNAISEEEQRGLIEFLRQVPGNHPQVAEINRRYELLNVSGLLVKSTQVRVH